MADESHTFGSTRARLEEIVTQVRKKDTSLEKSLDLLEEGVRLANACTELIDHQDWGVSPPESAAVSGHAAAGEQSGAQSEATAQPSPQAARDFPADTSVRDNIRDGAPAESSRYESAHGEPDGDDHAAEDVVGLAGGEDTQSHDSEAAQ
jgi:exodeoxyribonuclease VII small subunit